MPYYEYVCPDCKTRFEVHRSMKEIDKPTPCPRCHSPRAIRQISKVMVFSHGDGGNVSAFGGVSACSSCSGGTCSSCRA